MAVSTLVPREDCLSTIAIALQDIFRQLAADAE
jgi:hypothetical protein